MISYIKNILTGKHMKILTFVSIFFCVFILCAQPLQERKSTILVEPLWYDLDHNGSRVEQFGGKWILVGYITFKKRCKDIVCMETMHMHWNGLHLDNLIGSLYKKVSDREVFLPIEDNLVCDGVWNERTQTLIFDFDEEENLGPTTTFCLVLTVPGKVESILKKGSFSIEHRCLPYPFSQSIQNENLVLAIR